MNTLGWTVALVTALLALSRDHVLLCCSRELLLARYPVSVSIRRFSHAHPIEQDIQKIIRLTLSELCIDDFSMRICNAHIIVLFRGKLSSVVIGICDMKCGKYVGYCIRASRFEMDFSGQYDGYVDEVNTAMRQAMQIYGRDAASFTQKVLMPQVEEDDVSSMRNALLGRRQLPHCSWSWRRKLSK